MLTPPSCLSLQARHKRRRWALSTTVLVIACVDAKISRLMLRSYEFTDLSLMLRAYVRGVTSRRELLSSATAAAVTLDGQSASASTNTATSKCEHCCLKDWCQCDPHCDCHAVLSAEGYTVPRNASGAVAIGRGAWARALEWRAATIPGWSPAAEDSIEVKDSSIAGAGKGLFASVPLPVGTIIAPYVGKQLSVAEAQLRRNATEVTEYLWCPLQGNDNIDDIKGVDAQKPSYCVDPKFDTNPARFVNAAAEDAQCKLLNVEMCELGQVMYYRTLKSVAQGEELVTSYGPDYWQGWRGCGGKKSSSGGSRVFFSWLRSNGLL
mmetsp:Transcript_95912/g.213408  ORF Transcript_95912/g.213408 Transcript_95912/m.213408 type:complete len:322 (+) Transcript_95912:145-1110(+)